MAFGDRVYMLQEELLVEWIDLHKDKDKEIKPDMSMNDKRRLAVTRDHNGNIIKYPVTTEDEKQIERELKWKNPIGQLEI